MKHDRITGSIPALVTPFQNDGSIDYDALSSLVEWHIHEGSDALTVCGTTGESATITADEQADILRHVVAHVRGRIPVIAGTGANSTAEAIALARDAKAIGADVHLSVVPYYNKPTQEGIYLHFREIAAAVDLPLIVYNVPGRTVADMTTETALRLASVPQIVGIKDATGDVERGARLLQAAPDGFAVYSGDDGTAAALMLLGASGTISVTANLAPGLMHEMCAAAISGDAMRTRQLNGRLASLHQAVFLDPNPIPSKWGLHRMGLIANRLRLPMTPMREALIPQVEQAMREAGISISPIRGPRFEE